jgi:xylan 1,4-beta-xylosidase
VRPRLTLCVSAFVAGLGFSSSVAAQGRAVTIEVEATASGTPLERVWSYYGYDEVNYTTTQEGEDLLRTLATAHTAPVYVRTHFLFNTGDGTPALKWGSTNLYTENESGSPVYDYTLIDRIMDATTGAGTFPLVEIGFMPQALSVRPAPSRNSLASSTTRRRRCTPCSPKPRWGGPPWRARIALSWAGSSSIARLA